MVNPPMTAGGPQTPTTTDNSRTHLAAELGCTPTAARNLAATTYLEDLKDRQQQDQPTLF